jgi:hypothetical protein
LRLAAWAGRDKKRNKSPSSRRRMICRCEGIAIWYSYPINAKALLREIEALPQQEQVWSLEKWSALTEAEIPESFRQGIKVSARDELLDLDESLRELDRP